MRLSEWILAVYFSYATALSMILSTGPRVRFLMLAANGSLLCVYFVLLRAARIRPTAVARHLRNWIPLALMLLAYKEMGWQAPSAHDHRLEASWIQWDRLLLREWRMREAIEASGLALPLLLELSYLLVYALPAFCMAALYFFRRSRQAETLLVIYLLGLFLSYVQFPFWPSEPPWAVYPGDDAPLVETAVRRFNQWILRGYGIHTSVFPSAHVSGAVAAALALRRALGDRRWLYRGVFVYAALVAVATVYGRYHYAVDAAAGMVVGAAAAMLGEGLLRRYYAGSRKLS